jgi:hypothetical protein
MGESKKRSEMSRAIDVVSRKAPLAQTDQAQSVDTLGGRLQVRWDTTATATPHGQLAYFAQYLQATQVFERWVQSCPLSYASGNAPDKRDVLGTLLLSVLAGHRRYAHASALRGDSVAAQMLGMSKVVSEDALRRAVAKIEPQASETWLNDALMHSVLPCLDRPWIMDIDASVKPLYGHQQGAEISYNPHKPGRPSHVVHSAIVADLRLMLDCTLTAGKQHSSAHAKTGIGQLLDRLGERRATLVRGDSGYGNEGILLELEQRKQPYLLRLRDTSGVKTLVKRMFSRSDWSLPDAQGCQMVQATLKLQGWSRHRSVVVVRQRLRGGIARERKAPSGQATLDLLPSVYDAGQHLWEYHVLVSDVSYPLSSIAQLYRDRADAENAFDELKNQWGVLGYNSQQLHCCQTMVRACALIYNWWSWYCRAAKPEARMEAITSSPMLLAAVGRATSHANQTTLCLTPLHAKADVIKTLIANIDKALHAIKDAAQQLSFKDPWVRFVRYVSAQIAGAAHPKIPLNPTPATG